MMGWIKSYKMSKCCCFVWMLWYHSTSNTPRRL